MNKEMCCVSVHARALCPRIFDVHDVHLHQAQRFQTVHLSYMVSKCLKDKVAFQLWRATAAGGGLMINVSWYHFACLGTCGDHRPVVWIVGVAKRAGTERRNYGRLIVDYDRRFTYSSTIGYTWYVGVYPYMLKWTCWHATCISARDKFRSLVLRKSDTLKYR